MSKACGQTSPTKHTPGKPIVGAAIVFDKNVGERDAVRIIADVASKLPSGQIVKYHVRHSKRGRSGTKRKKGEQAEIIDPASAVDVASIGWRASRAEKFVENIASIAKAPAPVRAQMLAMIGLGIAKVPLSLASEGRELFLISNQEAMAGYDTPPR